MDIGSLSAAVSSLKTAADLAKTMIELNSISEIKGKIIDLQTQILAAQSSAFAANAEQAEMAEHVRALKEELARIKAWDVEKKRYKLTKLWDTGGVAYALKESMSNSEPPHYICTHCYEDGRKSVLSPQKNKNGGRMMLVCQNCKSEIHTHYTSLQAEYADK